MTSPCGCAPYCRQDALPGSDLPLPRSNSAGTSSARVTHASAPAVGGSWRAAGYAMRPRREVRRVARSGNGGRLRGVEQGARSRCPLTPARSAAMRAAPSEAGVRLRGRDGGHEHRPAGRGCRYPAPRPRRSSARGPGSLTSPTRKVQPPATPRRDRGRSACARPCRRGNRRSLRGAQRSVHRRAVYGLLSGQVREQRRLGRESPRR
jgi:hypothetical protein